MVRKYLVLLGFNKKISIKWLLPGLVLCFRCMLTQAPGPTILLQLVTAHLGNNLTHSNV